MVKKGIRYHNQTLIQQLQNIYWKCGLENVNEQPNIK